MTLLTMAALLAGTVLLAQEKPGRNAPAIPPERQKALDNALKHLFLVPPMRPPAKTPGPAVTVARGDSRCGHIRVIPADPSIDPKMLLPAEPPKPEEERYTMPVYKGLPPCEAPARSAPSKP